MPELPEVETLRSDLSRAIEGLEIVRVRLSDLAPIETSRREFYRGLPGKQVRKVRRRGKFLILELAPHGFLVLHLGMSGRVSLAPLPPDARDHVHMVLTLARKRGGLGDGREAAEGRVGLHFRDPRRFGRIRYLPRAVAEEVLPRLGLEPLEVDESAFGRIFRGRRAPIKNLLLNQSLLAGIGNIYADEALFRAKIHPSSPAGELTGPRMARLHAAIREVLLQAIAARGSTLRDYRDGAGIEGGFRDRHAVYGREGDPCPRCRVRIARIVLANRSAHFCPRCQRKTRKGRSRAGAIRGRSIDPPRPRARGRAKKARAG